MVQGWLRAPDIRAPVMEATLAVAAVWAGAGVLAGAAEEVSAREVITLHGESGNIPV